MLNKLKSWFLRTFFNIEVFQCSKFIHAYYNHNDTTELDLMILRLGKDLIEKGYLKVDLQEDLRVLGYSLALRINVIK